MRKNTNLKDRNNRYIYEGDTIKIFGNNFYGETISLGKVFFDKDTNKYCISVLPKGDLCGYEDLLEDYLDCCEVED